MTAFPHHPTGVIPPEYRGRKLMRERIDGIDVLRTWVYATANKGFLKRTLSYISFMLSAIFLGTPSLGGRYDVVIATSPQFFVAVAGFVISTLLAKPFVFELRDIWPESIVAVGALTDRRIIQVLEAVEMMLYRRARAICAVADSYVDVLADRGIDRRKVFVIKNGVDLKRFRPPGRSEGESVAREFGLGDRFVCTYIGTVGMAHGLDIILEAAERTREDDSIVYLVVGEGARRGELEGRAKQRSLANVIFAGQQPRERVVEFLAASHAVLVHLKKTDLFEKVIPSKIFEIMASARPLIMGVAGEAGRIVEEARAGVAIEPEDAGALVEAIKSLRADQAACEAMGRNGRRHVEKHFDRERLALDYLARLEELAEAARAGHALSRCES